MESIVCNGIGKIYGKKQVLKNINLTLEKGKIYGLIGRNGAGKTIFRLERSGFQFYDNICVQRNGI